MPEAFEHRHVVTFEDTNMVGNVYYVNHVRWQGKCRELFMRTYAPSLLEQFSQDFAMVTLRCSCEYLDEIFAFEEVIIRMRLASRIQNKLTLSFEYVRRSAGIPDKLVARGEQQVACMKKHGSMLEPTQIPSQLKHALAPFSDVDLGA